VSINDVLNRIHVATLLILLLAVVGAVLVLMGHLQWDQYYKDITVSGGLLSVGRGLSNVKIR
jgi:hypothetical protein